MAHRPTVLLVTVMMLLVPATAMAGDGHTTVSQAGVTVENDDEHETRIALPADSDAGEWGQALDGEVPAVNLALLPGGKLLYYSGVEANESQDETTDLHFMVNATPISARSRVATMQDDGTLDVQTPTPVSGGYYDLFCSGTTITPEGFAVAPGATEYFTMDEEPPRSLFAPLKGWNQTLLFPPGPVDDTERDWVQGPDMDTHRWYPSALQLSNGDTLVASGIQTLFYPHTYNTKVETFDPDTEQGWETLGTEIGVADESVPQNVLPQTDTGVTLADETHRGIPNLPMYPRLHTVPAGPHAGEVLYTGNGDVWGPFGEHPVQPLWGHFQTLDTTYPDSADWQVHSSSPVGVRNLGTTVPLVVDADEPEPKYLSFGGTLQQSGVATATAEVIDASGDLVTSTPTDSMTVPRWSVNGVLLPDGSVLSIGGSTYDNVLFHGSPTIGPLNVERYVPGDGPADGQWQLGPAMDGLRAYHSTAVLMPDASVIVGGHVPLPAFHDKQRNELGNPQPANSTFQVYEPAYLDRPGETRPSVTVKPADQASIPLATGGTALEVTSTQDEFTLHVDNVDEGLDSVILRRPGATTHQYNADQLGVELTVTDTNLDATGSGTVTLDNPIEGPGALELPPGYYMAFVNEDTEDGVYPSKAAWIALGDDVTGDTPEYGD